MLTYWILGRRFEDNHDRAIRYVYPLSDTQRAKAGIPKDSKVELKWCDRCSAYHFVRSTNSNMVVKDVEQS